MHNIQYIFYFNFIYNDWVKCSSNNYIFNIFCKTLNALIIYADRNLAFKIQKL